ncbi:MAG: hypothetical protein UT59_C0050G0001, partial [candidate division CPR2 bacterium GW2011_GWD1_39_7]
ISSGRISRMPLSPIERDFGLAIYLNNKGEKDLSKKFQDRCARLYGTLDLETQKKGLLTTCPGFLGVRMPLVINPNVFSKALMEGDLNGALESEFECLCGLDIRKAAEVAGLIAEMREQQGYSETVVYVWRECAKRYSILAEKSQEEVKKGMIVKEIKVCGSNETYMARLEMQ